MANPYGDLLSFIPPSEVSAIGVVKVGSIDSGTQSCIVTLPSGAEIKVSGVSVPEGSTCLVINGRVTQELPDLGISSMNTINI